jgi:hypothetical protein
VVFAHPLFRIIALESYRTSDLFGWQRFSGQQAVLDGDQRTFEEIAELAVSSGMAFILRAPLAVITGFTPIASSFRWESTWAEERR